MKKTTFILLVCISIVFLFSGCRDLPLQDDTVAYEADPAPLVVSSVKELVYEINRAKTVSKEDESYWLYHLNEIEQIDSILVPNVHVETHSLYRIVVNKYMIFYYYFENQAVAKGETQPDYNRDLIISVNRVHIEGDPLAPIERQIGLKANEDHVLFNKNQRDLIVAKGNTWVSIRYPETFREYADIMALCTFQEFQVSEFY